MKPFNIVVDKDKCFISKLENERCPHDITFSRKLLSMIREGNEFIICPKCLTEMVESARTKLKVNLDSIEILTSFVIFLETEVAQTN